MGSYLVNICVAILGSIPYFVFSFDLQPYLPFTHESSCLINIVLSPSTQVIPLETKAGVRNVLNTYTIHNAFDLKLDISEGNGREQNISITITTGYFRFAPKYTDGLPVFMLLTNDYLVQTLQAIQKSGYSNSDRVIFFTRCSSFNYNILRLMTQFFKLLPQYNVQPFHSSVVFYTESNEDLVYILCYFCGSSFAKLIPFKSHFYQELQHFFKLLNSNGYGRKVHVAFPYEDVISFLPAELLAYLPPDSCLTGFSSYKNGLKSLISALTLCDRKRLVVFSSMQAMLNITIQIFDSTHSFEGNWHLQMYITHSRLLQMESTSVANSRGHYFVNVELSRSMVTYVVCFDYSQYSSYDLTNFTIVDWTVWISVALTCFVLAFITKNLFIGISVLGVWICTEINLNSVDRRICISFLVPMAILGFVHQSYISSESTRIQGFPDSLSFGLENGYKVWISQKDLLIWAFNTFLPQYLIDMGTQNAMGHAPENLLTSEKNPYQFKRYGEVHGTK